MYESQADEYAEVLGDVMYYREACGHLGSEYAQLECAEMTSEFCRAFRTMHTNYRYRQLAKYSKIGSQFVTTSY